MTEQGTGIEFFRFRYFETIFGVLERQIAFLKLCFIYSTPPYTIYKIILFKKLAKNFVIKLDKPEVKIFKLRNEAKIPALYPYNVDFENQGYKIY